MTRTPEPRTRPPAPARILAAVTCCGDVWTSAHLEASDLVDGLIAQLPQALILLAARHAVLVYECVLDESTRQGGYYHNGRRYAPRAVVAEYMLTVDLLVSKAYLN